MVGLKRLVSLPGWIVLAALAVPWWIAAAASGGVSRFVDEFVLKDQLRFYFGHGGGTTGEP
jgi:4-amino-4-deoxy-L-arabinose transferase-like glycosyltransferase